MNPNFTKSVLAGIVLLVGVPFLGAIALFLAGTVSFFGISRYPIDVCRCSKIYKSNSYDIGLANKKTNIVLLVPAVELVKTISPTAIVLSNLKSQKLVDNPQSSGHRYWKPRPSSTEQGYFLHQCDSHSELVHLGMNRGEAIAKAQELVGTGRKRISHRSASQVR
jgi:hypothetical protein